MVRIGNRVIRPSMGVSPFVNDPVTVGGDSVLMDKLSIYVPQDKRQHEPIERLTKLAKDRDRSVNYLVVQAILDFVEREEKKDKGGR